jgi:hypothetical protein
MKKICTLLLFVSAMFLLPQNTWSQMVRDTLLHFKSSGFVLSSGTVSTEEMTTAAAPNNWVSGSGLSGWSSNYCYAYVNGTDIAVRMSGSTGNGSFQTPQVNLSAQDGKVYELKVIYGRGTNTDGTLNVKVDGTSVLSASSIAAGYQTFRKEITGTTASTISFEAGGGGSNSEFIYIQEIILVRHDTDLFTTDCSVFNSGSKNIFSYAAPNNLESATGLTLANWSGQNCVTQIASTAQGASIRFGASTGLGVLTTPSLNLSKPDGKKVMLSIALARAGTDARKIVVKLDGVKLNDSIKITTDANVYTTYNWQITGGTTTSKLTFEAYGLDGVTANQTIYMNKLEVYLQSDFATGVEENPSNAVQVYPNPCAGYVNVSNARSVAVYTLTGTKIGEYTFSGETSIPTSGWNRGVYLLRVISVDGKAQNVKLVKGV